MSGGGFERAYQDEATERVKQETRQTTTLEWYDATIIVYLDEVIKLRADIVLYGNMFVKQNEVGVCERIPPSDVGPVE